MRLLVTLLLLLVIPFPAYSAAWTQKKGEGQIITNYTYYRTKTQFTYDGDRARLNRHYVGHTLNPYIEYGLTDDITVGANIFLEHGDFTSPVASANGTNYGINDTELFLRHRLWHGPTYALSAQGMVIVPGFHDEDRNPRLGQRKWGAEARFLAGMNVPILSDADFINTEITYRYRAGIPSDELRADVAMGVYMGESNWLMWLNELSGTLRMDGVQTGTLLAPSAPNANLLKGQTSFVSFLDDAKKNAIQLGYFRHIAGEDTGAGGGVLLSVWHQF